LPLLRALSTLDEGLLFSSLRRYEPLSPSPCLLPVSLSRSLPVPVPLPLLFLFLLPNLSRMADPMDLHDPSLTHDRRNMIDTATRDKQPTKDPKTTTKYAGGFQWKWYTAVREASWAAV
jgi:hypothetical protein